MIKHFRHKVLELFFRTGSTAKIQAAHAARLKRQLLALHHAAVPKDMAIPGWRLHPLGYDLDGHWSVWVSGNWRLTFAFEGHDALQVDYQDYH
ncbi:type II toxin-antitoxin system RelE/ParE family toxin [Bordetella petrii]|uniref:type II toxin-antitoxin system RelE/ParE family toxin n=1 Tax=Bordetella petrii TaxID=94624 RepID=UPI001A96A9B7|nr:type II toxin-antitoxin system RelE/ParE family toxin [Bordetella petrii]MBO1112301.1 type II toxin-antitoxin system RelE/ParE family toxin [Bordetella petrii]